MKQKILTFLSLLIMFSFGEMLSAKETEERPYLFFPKAYEKWDFEITAGLSLTKLPMNVVEEEINQSPMPGFEMRFGLPWDLSLRFDAKSNYIANYGALSVQWSYNYGMLSASFGGKFSAWFGHLDIESFNLKAEGMILSPVITLGWDFDDYLISAAFETQTSRMWTQIDDKEIGRFDKKISGVGFDINIEQPLWHNHWVVMGVKFNYTKFYYQSWLSYSTIDEYLLYPEFKFGFIL